MLNILYIVYNERNCRTIKQNKWNTNINSPNIKKQMNEILISVTALVALIFAIDYLIKYYNKWMKF